MALRDSAAGVSYLYGDQLGSVSFATNANGSATSRQDFDAWGAVRSGGISQTSLNYTGQRLDSTGLLDYHARLYDPVLARFVSADSVVPGAGALTLGPDKPSNGPADPQALNRYAYVNNNPIKYADPSGHCPWCLVGAIAGGAIAYGAQVYSNYQSGMDLGQAMTTNINGAAIIIGAVAGAVVGGSLGMATGAIAGYTVGSALELGALGSVTNMAGNVIGQAATSTDINLTDVAVAGVTGFAAGIVAPVVGSTAIGSMAGGYVGAVALGAVANSAQYVATQSIKDDAITTGGMMANAISGAVGGAFGGPTSKLEGLSFLKPSLKAKELLRENITRVSLLRGLWGGATSNMNYGHYIPGAQ